LATLYHVELIKVLIFYRMLVNGRSFGGTTHYLDAYRHLLASKDHLPWLSEINPLARFPHQRFIQRLLYLFHVHGPCCYLTGSLLYYSTGLFNAFNSAGIFMVLTQSSRLLELIFQRHFVHSGFLFDNFLFHFVSREPNSDILFYDVSERNVPTFRLRIVFFGVTTTRDCGLESNLDLVQFCFDNAKRFNSIKYDLVLLPKFMYRRPFGYCLPRLICLRYYRTLSYGWRDEFNCHRCTDDNRRIVRPTWGVSVPPRVLVRCIRVSLPPCAMRRHTYSFDTCITFGMCFG
jgi:hypothetical protein